MTTYVLTCDKYRFLMPGFAHLFNKYFGEFIPVIVPCFTPPTKLPGNFRSFQIAEQEIGQWTDAVRPFFEQADDYFLLLLDDYWLIDYVSREYLTRLEIEIRQGADKADINGNTRRALFDMDKPCILLNQQTSRYRSNLQPAIWRREYFLKLLKPNRSIWEFERIGQREAINDKARIVALDLPPDQIVYNFANVYKKGQPSLRHIAKINAEDRKALCDMGYANLLEGV